EGRDLSSKASYVIVGGRARALPPTITGSGMVTEAHAEPVRARRHISEFVMPAAGLTLVALVVVWLAINLEQDPARFFRVSLIGVSQGALYALVALGYTLVYGILELINFAHGDVFMICGMITAPIVLQVCNLDEHP